MDPFPDVVRIEPSGLCNFSCIHCPIGLEGGHRRLLSFDRFQKYFQALPLVPRVLVLYHGGEPLLNKELEKMIAYAKTQGVKHTVFNSNAALLTPERGMKLGLAGLDELRVSFDGDSALENDRVRVNSHFEKHAAQVREVARSPVRPRNITIYNARIGTERPAEYLFDYFAGCEVSFRGVQMRHWARLKNEALPSNGTAFCTNLFDTFTILSDGNVVMCCEDLQADDIVGNVEDETPLSIWNRLDERRQAFRVKNYPKLCQSCWVVTGNFLPSLETPQGEGGPAA